MYYRQSLRDRKKRIWLIIGGVLVLACCIGFYPFTEYMSEREQARITPNPTPVPDTFTGTLLLLGTASEGMLQLHSLAGDMTGPTAPLGGEFPGDVNLTGSRKFVSPDGKLTVLMSREEVAVLDLSTGERTVILPEPFDGRSGAFSPDNRYLVLGEETKYHITKLLLFDLSTNSEPLVLYDAPSARYGNIVTKAYGSVYQPLWLDAETLVYSSYEGAMPEQITSVGGVTEILPPNSTSLLRIVAGEVTHRIISETGEIYQFSRAGATTAGGVLTAPFFTVKEFPASWLNLDRLKQGSIQPYQPFPTNSEWFGRVPDFVSPDGRYAVFTDRPMDSLEFHLVDLRTGAETGSASFTEKEFEKFSPRECLDLSWSPDMQSLACRFNDRLVILSFSGGKAFPLKVDLVDMIPWRLLTWQP